MHLVDLFSTTSGEQSCLAMESEQRGRFRSSPLPCMVDVRRILSANKTCASSNANCHVFYSIYCLKYVCRFCYNHSVLYIQDQAFLLFGLLHLPPPPLLPLLKKKLGLGAGHFEKKKSMILIAKYFYSCYNLYPLYELSLLHAAFFSITF